MPPSEFETVIPVSDRPQTYALDRAANGIGRQMITPVLNQVPHRGTRLMEGWHQAYLVSGARWGGGRFVSFTTSVAALAGKSSLELTGGADRMDWTVRVSNPVGVRLFALLTDLQAYPASCAILTMSLPWSTSAGA